MNETYTYRSYDSEKYLVSVSQFNYTVWLGGVVVRALDLRLEIAGSIPAAALSSATLDSCSHTLSSASEVTTLWRYINQFKIKKKIPKYGRLSWPALWSTFGRTVK